MAAKTKSVTVTTSAVELTSTITNIPVHVRRTNGYGYARQIALRPTADIFVGGSDVTTSNGWLVKADEVHTFELFGDDRLYGVVASSSTTVLVYEGGL